MKAGRTRPPHPVGRREIDALLAQGVDAARDLRRFRFFTTAFATRSQGIVIPHPHLLTAAVRGRRPLRRTTCAAVGPRSRGGGRRVCHSTLARLLDMVSTRAPWPSSGARTRRRLEAWLDRPAARGSAIRRGGVESEKVAIERGRLDAVNGGVARS